MKKLTFENTVFLKSALHLHDCPHVHKGKDYVPEVAFVGRSNVGKSSLINHLTGCKGLAKTSSVPGKTQTINFFLIDRRLGLVDLPGYGYSEVAGDMKKAWSESLQNYLQEREELKLICLLIDLRRELLTQEDKELILWAVAQGKPLFFIFTKADKLTKEIAKQTTMSLSKEISILYKELPVECITYSVKEIDCKLKLRDKLQKIAQ